MCKKKKMMMAKMPYITVGILFIVAGAMKLFVASPAMFAGMIEMHFGMFGLVGGAAVVAAWVIAIAELLGGLSLLMCKVVPAMIKKILITLLMLILIGAIIFVHAKGMDIMSALKDLVLLSILMGACSSLCCGKKCVSACKKDCADGMCDRKEEGVGSEA